MAFLKRVKQFIFSKQFLKISGILVLIYIAIIGGTIFYLDTYTNHGEKIPVPQLVGQNVNNISALLEEKGLKFEIVDHLYKPKLAEGTIIDQDPEVTEISKIFVKQDRIIRLRVSKRTQLVEMPSLIDKSERFATTILKNRGFRLKISYKNTPESNGAVIEQRFKGARIKEGTKIPIGSTILLIVGRNEGGIPIPVINLYGLTISEARERLASMPGITFFPVCQDCNTAADSLSARIGSQSPQYEEGAMMPSVGTISATAIQNLPEIPPSELPE
jgi:eukaryotic-like serine/threonine-protein kinase